jgi:DNA polymerase-3 subunit epsilon
VPRQPEFVPGRDEFSVATSKALRASKALPASKALRASKALPASDALRASSQRRWVPWPEEGANPLADEMADPAHPLFGHRIVFTGSLGMTRAEAKARAAALGAQPASSVTRATTLLVVGDGFVASDLRAGLGTGRVTSKARRALELRSAGYRVEVLSEGEFLQMLGGEWPARSA